MLLAVAAALLLVQGLGAFLVYRAQSERREAALIHGAAFRLLVATRKPEAVLGRPGTGGPFEERRRRPRIERSAESPLRTQEARDRAAENELEEILAEQGVFTRDVVVMRRKLADDPVAWQRAQRRADMFRHHPRSPDDTVLIAGIRPEDREEWLVARIFVPPGERQIVLSLIGQTLTIYLVLVAAIAMILRRITRPLAALTGRLEQFAETRNPDGQLEPQGPDDVRRLIVAHNAMEGRISSLLDEKDVMLGAIGHDLKTPLAALRVRIESVENETERDRMAATIEDIVRSLDDILSLARVGRPSDPYEHAELSALVASVVEEYEDMGENVELGETERVALPLRPTWLRRALRNLMGNALRYGKRARVSLAREGDWAVIRIDDDGPGIPDEQIAPMMEPFTRGDPSRNSETGGAGLGLTLARAIADQHGGSLQLANRRDAEGRIAGLTASLRLPLPSVRNPD
ncbi:MAG: two-component sensor histidine kinase [Novosphingobium sp.]|nr:two-component sensor histidine kinase [Novosphingobium sp.]MCP5403287.1 two-component sensor histidine kinase [Novosphingobium sp.]